MRFQSSRIAVLTAVGALAACGQPTAEEGSADAVVSEAEAAAAAIRARAGDAGAAPAGGAPVETTSAGGPKRRDGWWELTSTAQSGTQYLCVGGGSEEVFSLFDQLLFSLGDCENENFVRRGAGWAFDLRCDMVGDAIGAKGTIGGDFRNTFVVEQTVTTGGGARTGTIRSVHKGACPAAFKPGDLVSDGQVLMNVLE